MEQESSADGEQILSPIDRFRIATTRIIEVIDDVIDIIDGQVAVSADEREAVNAWACKYETIAPGLTRNYDRMLDASDEKLTEYATGLENIVSEFYQQRDTARQHPTLPGITQDETIQSGPGQ